MDVAASPPKTEVVASSTARGAFLRRIGLVALSGVLGALAFPLAFPIGPRHELLASGILEPLAFVCLVPALIAVRGLRARKAYLWGYYAGWVFFTCAFWWVNVAMTTFGGMPNALSIPALLLLSGWCAFHWGLAFFLVRLFASRLHWSPGWTIGPVWMATELLRNYNCSGFPWANLGYSQMRNLWFSQVGSVLGVYGVALFIAVVNGALYEVWRSVRLKERPFPRALVATAAGLLIVGHAYGAWHVHRMDALVAKAPTMKVAVVQGNIDQKLKLSQGNHAQTVLGSYLPATEKADEAGADLIVWPEASFPLAFPKHASFVPARWLGKERYSAHLLLGVDVIDPADLRNGNENAAFVVGPDLSVKSQYTKYHLVPFGEYVLFDLDKYLPIENLVPGTFKKGTELDPRPLELSRADAVAKNPKIGIEICFDAIFPEISRHYAHEGAQVLVNMTNDAWYGFSSAPFQFLRMVAMRAIETGRPVARAANTGISAFIDPVGRIQQPTPIGLVESDENEVDVSRKTPGEWRIQNVPLLEGRTPYVVIGDFPSYIASAFCLVGFVLAVRRKRTAAA